MTTPGAPQYLSPAEWECLSALDEACAANEETPVSPRQVADFGGNPEAEVRLVLEGLVAKGLAFRMPADGTVH